MVSPEEDDIFTKMSLLFVEAYEEIDRMERLIEFCVIKHDRRKYTNELPVRYAAIVAEYQKQLLAQPPSLTTKQKRFITMFLDGHCTDGFLMTNLKVSEWAEMEKLIHQYQKESGE